MNSKSDAKLTNKARTGARPSRTFLRLVARGEPEPKPMRPAEIARQVQMKHDLGRHPDDDDDDPGPAVA